MSILNINQKYLKNFEYDLNYGSESTRYFNDEIMIKILNKDCLLDDRQQIIELLHNFNHDNIVKLYDDVYEKNMFVGYTMKYLKGYMHFDKFQKSNTSFNKRKEIIMKIASIFDYFDKMNFAFHDIHKRNILIKDDDVKLIDLDGGVLYGYVNGNIDFDTSLKNEKKSLSRFLLSTLYSVSENELLDTRDRKKDYKLLISMLPKYLKGFYEYTLNDEYSIYYGITESLNNIDENLYEESYNLIKNRFH